MDNTYAVLTICAIRSGSGNMAHNLIVHEMLGSRITTYWTDVQCCSATTNHPAATGGYNPDDYEDLPVSQEVQDLFQYILQYKPEVPQLETPLKPFIPDYIPAIGDIDEFIKVQFIESAGLMIHRSRHMLCSVSVLPAVLLDTAA